MHGSPQMAMDPMPLTDNLPLVRDHAAEFHGVSGWPAQPKLVPTVIVCTQYAAVHLNPSLQVHVHGTCVMHMYCSSSSLVYAQSHHKAFLFGANLGRMTQYYGVVGTGSHGGEHVEVEGSFDNWTTRQQMQKSGKDFTIIKLLPPGVYQARASLTACVSACWPWRLPHPLIC